MALGDAGTLDSDFFTERDTNHFAGLEHAGPPCHVNIFARV